MVLLLFSYIYMYFLPVFSLLGSRRELAALLASPGQLAASAKANGALRHIQLSQAITVDDGLIWSCCMEKHMLLRGWKCTVAQKMSLNSGC